MKSISVFFPAFFLLLFSFSAHAEIGDKVPGCKVVYDAAKTQTLQNLTALEETYLRYRNAEFKIRIFEYTRLWKARAQSNEPLQKDVRTAGQIEEDRVLEELAYLDDISQKASNSLLEGLKKLKNLQELFAPCCPDPDIQACLGKSFEPFSEKVDTGIDYFGHIFEHEREYRKEVGLTIGGRKGIYPDDTVEAESVHGDFFARYEVERRQNRFEEDVWMASFFQDLKKMLTDSFPGDHCCLGCGVTDWERKGEKFFNAGK